MITGNKMRIKKFLTGKFCLTNDSCDSCMETVVELNDPHKKMKPIKLSPIQYYDDCEKGHKQNIGVTISILRQYPNFIKNLQKKLQNKKFISTLLLGSAFSDNPKIIYDFISTLNNKASQKITILDPVRTPLTRARTKCLKIALKNNVLFNFIQGFGEDNLFPPHYFDVEFLDYTLSFVDWSRQKLILKQISKHLKKDGLVITKLAISGSNKQHILSSNEYGIPLHRSSVQFYQSIFNKQNFKLDIIDQKHFSSEGYPVVRAVAYQTSSRISSKNK